MNVKSFIFALVIMLFALTDGFAQEKSLDEIQVPNDATTFRSLQNDELSANLVYERFFQLFAAYRKEADKQEQLVFPERANVLRTHFQRKIELDEQQFQEFFEIAEQFRQEAATLKEQANKFRVLAEEQSDNQEFLNEVGKLKTERSSLWSKSHESLQSKFDEQIFDRFQAFLQQEIAGKTRRTIHESKDKGNLATSNSQYVDRYSTIDYEEENNQLYAVSLTAVDEGGGGPYFTGGNNNNPYFFDYCD